MTLIDEELEWRTRRERVDPRLVAAGWGKALLYDGRPLDSRGREAVREYPTELGPADYALVNKGRILGVVEAKKVGLGPQEVLKQAERYSRGALDNPMSFGEYRVPFLYSTNGTMIRFRDSRHPLNRSRDIAGFHTAAALEEMLERDFDAACLKLAETPNDHPLIRAYQRERIRR